MSYKLALAVAFASLAVTACAPDSGELDQDQDEADEGRALSVDTVYKITGQDFRKCASPMCGGVYVKAVNKAKTKCFDGTSQNECYVGSIDLSPIGVEGDEAVALDASLKSGSVLASGNISLLQGGIGKLVVQKALEPASDTAATGTFYLVQPSGITCITAPCPSLRTVKVNLTAQKNITDLDFSLLGISDEEEAELGTTVFEKNLIVSGTISKKGNKTILKATQAFTTFEPAPVAEELCLSDSACGAGSHCDFSVCHSNCPPDRVCPAVCWGACTAGDPTPAPDSCVAACGGQSADESCYCDSACEGYGDCCSDYAAVCQ